MRKISLILVIFVLTAPALARVDIYCEPNVTDLNSVTVRYNVTGETERVRAFALDISLSGDVNVAEVNDFHAGESSQWTAKGYGIFPASFAANIDPESPEWDDAGYIPVGDEADYPEDTLGGLDTNGITVELGSLFVEEVNAPGSSGVLLEFTAENPDNTFVTLALNQIRGGIVLEDTNAPLDVNLTGCIIRQDCLIDEDDQEYDDWVDWDKPDCWCYKYQCRGDADDTIEFSRFRVLYGDVDVLAAAAAKEDAELATIVVNGVKGICADFDHGKEFNRFRVLYNDVGALATYVATEDIPACDEAPVTTGPYNFWTTAP
jgi:hypothetical protein